MTVTAKAISGRTRSLKLNITAALVAATSLTTVEKMQINSVVKSTSGGHESSAVSREYVFGGATAIIDASDKVEVEPFVMTLLYTNGKETLGTDTKDPSTILKEIFNLSPKIPLQIEDSPAGANSGDELFTSSLTESYITGIQHPESDAEGTNKVQLQVTIDPGSWTVSTVA